MRTKYAATIERIRTDKSRSTEDGEILDAIGDQDPGLWRYRAGIELSGARTRLRPHPPRPDARLPDRRRTLPDRGLHRLSLQPDHGNAWHARAAVPREHDREPAGPAR